MRPPAGWMLGRVGRFSHDAAYVTAALTEAGLALCRMAPQVQRMDGGIGVLGLAGGGAPDGG